MQNYATTAVRSRRLLRETTTIRYETFVTNSGKTLIVARGTTEELAQTLAELYSERSRYFLSVDVNLECKKENACMKKCASINFLPVVINSQYSRNDTTLVLDFDCFSVGRLVLAKDLAQRYCVDLPTAKRLVMGLATLIDRLVRWNIVVELVIDNLMIDLETAAVTLLDWSAAKVEPIIAFEETMFYHARLAEIIFELSGVEFTTEGVLCPALGEAPVKNEFFQILSQLKRNYSRWKAACMAVDKTGATESFLDLTRELHEQQLQTLHDLSKVKIVEPAMVEKSKKFRLGG